MENNHNTHNYCSPDLVTATACKYIVEELSKEYEPTDIHIPYAKIIAIEYLNNDGKNIYGDFLLENYNIVEDTLECVSTGSYSGVMHSDKNNKVIKFDILSNCDTFEEDAKKMFGSYYDIFMKVYTDGTDLEKNRNKTLSEYVKKNNLKVTKYQDEGWEPVELNLE